MRKWKLKLRHSGIVIDADERPTKLKLRVASFRYSYCLLLLRMHCFLRLHCLVWLHCLYIVASQFQEINVVQRQMLRAIVGWVAADGNECGRFLRRMNNVKTILIILSDLHMDGFFIQTGLFPTRGRPQQRWDDMLRNFCEHTYGALFGFHSAREHVT